MTVPQLKEALRERSLRVSGKKSVLIARLEESEGAGAGSTSAVARGQADAAAGEAVEEEAVTDSSEAVGAEVGDNEWNVEVGIRVDVEHQGKWFPSGVLEMSPDGKSITVRYDDGGDEEPDVDVATRVRKLEPIWIKKGLDLEVEFEDKWFKCRVLKVDELFGTCTVVYEDGGEVEDELELRGDRLRPIKGAHEKWEKSRVDLAKVRNGMYFEGVVVTTADFGAFVDIGAERDGLVPKSLISNRYIDSVDDIVEIGQKVDVWLARPPDAEGKYALSMVQSKVRGATPKGNGKGS